jgi:peptide/nickel transport system substrate-binding protein
LPRASGVTYLPIPDTAVKLTNLRSGAIHLVDEVAAADVDSISNDQSLKLYTIEGSRWPMIRLNLLKPPFDNKAVRQAVSLAVNREGIAAAVFFGHARPAYGPMSPLYPTFYNPEIEQLGFGFDLDEAKRRLDEAGISNLSFTLDMAGTPDRIRTGELIQASLAEIGVNMEISTLESAAFTARLQSREFDAALGSWTPRPDVDGIIHPHFHTEGLSNWVSYSNPEVDDLLNRTRSTPPGPERIKLFQDAEKIIVDDAPWIFLVFEELARATLDNVQDYVLTPDTVVRLRETWISDD